MAFGDKKSLHSAKRPPVRLYAAVRARLFACEWMARLPVEAKREEKEKLTEVLTKGCLGKEETRKREERRAITRLLPPIFLFFFFFFLCLSVLTRAPEFAGVDCVTRACGVCTPE